MDRIMNVLYTRLQPLVEAGWFKKMIYFIILCNPFAIFPQVLTALTAPSVEGISLIMWAIFATIQIAFSFDAIKNKNRNVFLSMFLSFLESTTIVVTVMVRG